MRMVLIGLVLVLGTLSLPAADALVPEQCIITDLNDPYRVPVDAEYCYEMVKDKIDRACQETGACQPDYQ